MNLTLLWQRMLTQVARSSATRFERMSRERALDWGARVGRMGYRLAQRPRRIAQSNLRLAYGDTLSPAERDLLVRRIFEHFGKVTVDFLRSPGYDAPTLHALVAEVVGLEEYGDTAIAQGRGVVLTTAHLGNWEIFGRYIAMRGYPLTVVARDPKDPELGAYLRQMRESAGYQVASKGNSARELLATLKRGQVLGILPDQNSGDLFVPFFGVPAGTVAGPAILALRTGAPLLSAYCLLLPDNRYRIEVLPPIETTSTGDRDADSARIMTAVNRDLEDRVRAYPEQWLWLHNRWKSSFEEKNRVHWPAGYDFDAARARWQA